MFEPSKIINGADLEEISLRFSGIIPNSNNIDRATPIPEAKFNTQSIQSVRSIGDAADSKK